MSPRRLAIAVAGLALLTTACGGPDVGATASAGNDEVSDAAAPTSVEVAHAMGTTEVPCTPDRVVTLGQGQTDTALALGVTPVGVVSPWTPHWYGYLPDQVEEATVVGDELEPSLEAIAALEPDVILGSKMRHEAIYNELSAIAPTVFSETIGMAWKDNVSLWARALCRKDEGDRVLAGYEERVAEVAGAIGDPAAIDVSLIRFRSTDVRIYLTGFAGTVMRDVGLNRPAAQQVDDWDASPQLIEVSEEQIPEMDGDVILVMVSADWGDAVEGQDADDVMEQWTGTELWQQLSAVRAGDVHEVNEDHWNLGGGILAAHALLDDLEELLGGPA